ncbi:YELLOW STRIPE like 7 [Perilla frutescens var. frutescens]|nr:YELLOW STRIPE like 7 [Perilla frutescens var. frutescens]
MEGGDSGGGDEVALERAFEEMPVPPWQNQITIRAMVTSLVLSLVFNVIVCKLNLSTGVIPSLNVAAGLLGFAAVKAWTVTIEKCGFLKQPFTRQENTLRRPVLNSPSKKGGKQVWVLFKSFVSSFLWAFFQWFFTAADGCGFSSFPTFGLQAYNRRFYFDFSATYVGVGMICPYMVNVSLLIGAIISWGIMWPVIESKKGDWYSADIPASSLHGIQGYRVFLAIAIILGDGLFQVIYMVVVTLKSFIQQLLQKTDAHNESEEGALVDYNEMRRTEFFLKDQIPDSVAIGGYAALALLSTFVVPLIFPQLKWYQILVAYVFAPVLAFCNAYGCGLTDWSLASNYGKLAILVFSSWVGLDHGGVLAGLASCGVMMSIVSTASDLMQDFKTGYLTLSSPRSMFISQVYGTAMGCVLSPMVFWCFYKAYSVGDPEGSYPAPYALMYRGIALLGVEGFDSLPKNCLKLVVVCFLAALLINLVIKLLREYETKYRIYRVIPSPMCMAIPFYLGGYFAIDMCIGSLILFVWEMKNKNKASDFAPAVASGLICGDSLWGIPAAILALAGVKPPICMKFLSAKANRRVDSLLGG